jgi:hypothetical protein
MTRGSSLVFVSVYRERETRTRKERSGQVRVGRVVIGTRIHIVSRLEGCVVSRTRR